MQRKPTSLNKACTPGLPKLQLSICLIVFYSHRYSWSSNQETSEITYKLRPKGHWNILSLNVSRLKRMRTFPTQQEHQSKS